MTWLKKHKKTLSKAPPLSEPLEHFKFSEFSLQDWKIFLSKYHGNNLLDCYIPTKNSPPFIFKEKAFIFFFRSANYSLLDFSPEEIKTWFEIDEIPFHQQKDQIDNMIKNMGRNDNFKVYINNYYYLDQHDSDYMHNHETFPAMMHHFFYVFEEDNYQDILYDYTDGGNNEIFLHIITKALSLTFNPESPWCNSWVPKKLKELIESIYQQNKLLDKTEIENHENKKDLKIL